MSAIRAVELDLIMSEAEYLDFEDASETKHEFVDGHVYDWPGYEYDAQGSAGATRAHNRLQVGILAALEGPATAAGCQAYGSDMRLRVRLESPGRRSTRRYYYPDAMVLCDHESQESGDEMHVTRPCLIVEVVSPRSARIDHTEKLQVYQSIDSMQTYVIVHQAQRRVEHYWRDLATCDWQTDLLTDGALPIDCVGFELALDAIYGPVNR